MIRRASSCLLLRPAAAVQESSAGWGAGWGAGKFLLSVLVLRAGCVVLVCLFIIKIKEIKDAFVDQALFALFVKVPWYTT